MALEIEKKFLVPVFPEDGAGQGIYICQGYMLNSKRMVSRVRIFGDQGFLTLKSPTIDGVRHEFEYPVPLKDARQMLEIFCEKPFVEKTRYTLYHQNFEWVIDRFSGANEGLIVAEIELDCPDTVFEKPDWAGEEVSHDPRYFNSNLTTHPFSEWVKD